MLRYSIRDLLWLTLVMAMASGWFLSYGALRSKLAATTRQLERHHSALKAARQRCHELNVERILAISRSRTYINQMDGPVKTEVDWGVLEEVDLSR